MTELEQAAETAGLLDLDLLKIARPNLSASDAVADLRGRYPQGFKPPAPPKMYAAMTAAERQAFHRRNHLPMRAGL